MEEFSQLQKLAFSQLDLWLSENKLSKEAESFLAAAQRQLAELEIQAQAGLVYQPQIVAENQGKQTGSRSLFLRRTLKIKDKQVVGFALQVEGLSAEESIRLQEKGLGGRRHFGCGLFTPDQRR